MPLSNTMTSSVGGTVPSQALQRLSRPLSTKRIPATPCPSTLILSKIVSSRTGSRTPAATTLPTPSLQADVGQPRILDKLKHLATSTAVSCALLLSPVVTDPPAASAVGRGDIAVTEKGERLSIRFPASQDPGIRSAQELLVQTWGESRARHVAGFTSTGWVEGGDGEL